MISNSQQVYSPKNSWLTFPLGEMDKGFLTTTSVLMGHHLFVFAHGPEMRDRWTINLQDNSVQTNWEYSFGITDSNYTLTKYGENQIIKFGGDMRQKAVSDLVLLTIDSFHPLTVRSEVIQDENAPKLSGHTAAMYKNYLYVFGGRQLKTRHAATDRLWCYDIKTRIWKLCHATGESPRPREKASSFIINDNLYIFGGFTRGDKEKIDCTELFELNLRVMKWKKIEWKYPKPGQDSTFFDRFSANIYGNSLLVLKNEAEGENDKLYCCNRGDLTSWSCVNMEGFEGIKPMGNSFIYKNVLYTCATKNTSTKKLYLAALQLVDFPVPRSQKEKFSSLFMNESEADFQFRIKDELIPAHKEVLVKKSRFFGNLFDDFPKKTSFEIDDHQAIIFKKFLQYLYCGTLEANILEAVNLFSLAQQYEQEDLAFKCVNILVRNLTPDNAYWMLDFASDKNINFLKGWCKKFIEENLSFEEIIRCDKFWQSSENQQLAEKCVDFLLKDLCKYLSGDQSALKLYEEFLVRSVSMQNIVQLSEGYVHFQLKMTKLRDAMFNFVDINLQELQEQGLYKKLQWCFEIAFSGWRKKQMESPIPSPEYSTAMESETEPVIRMSEKEERSRAQRKAVKRMEPSSHSSEEAERIPGPILKKNKQVAAY